MNQKLIEQLRNGEIAVENKGGTLDQLRAVLSAAFPEDRSILYVIAPYYIKANRSSILWVGVDETDLPSYQISAFLEDKQQEFTRGELVEVRISKIAQWEKRIIVEVIEGALRPYVCVHSSYEDEFNAGGKFETVKWKYCRKIITETAGDKLADKIIEATENDEIVTDIEHDDKAKTITIKYK